ncbi:MAG: glycosyltransferase [Gammaproteobacteria bacterium]|nr:MAG: glycosyltransferase [Gammaproteobacteria bacterium]
MNILHVGWGFIPWRSGGLATYAHDLMDYQAEQGWRVDYFCAGRHYPFGRPSTLKEWHRGKIRVHEIINSPILHGGDRGTLRPDLELTEAETEKMFIQTVEKVKPDILHIHELAGLPSSLIDLAKERFGLPILMTLADYFLLCPTLKLFDVSGHLCMSVDLASDCLQCCAGAPKSRRVSELRTLTYRLKPYVLKLPESIRLFIAKSLHVTERRAEVTGKNRAFVQRRKTNLERLEKIDVLVARSARVAQLYQQHLGDKKRIEVLNPTLRHIDQIKPSVRKHTSRPIRFVTLNGLASVAKGGEVLLRAVELLSERGYGEQFELIVFGGCSAVFRGRLDRLKNVNYRGPYRAADLDHLLEGMDVGVVPSVWEEVFGYVGPEMLAKGIPVIGNAVGGITEYVIEGQTGWLNRSSTAEELAGIMAGLIDNPDRVTAVHAAIVHQPPLQTYADHFLSLVRLYEKAAGNPFMR